MGETMRWYEKAKGDTKKEVIDNTPRKRYHLYDYKFSRFCLLNLLRPRGLKSRGLFVAIVPSSVKMTDRKSAVGPSAAPDCGRAVSELLPGSPGLGGSGHLTIIEEDDAA